MSRRRSQGLAQRRASAPQQLRIIGGQWRGRKLPVASAPGLRPTANRLRETLFNWLQTRLYQAQCLDLYAGSGALGLEALSRGAAHCTFVEVQPAAIRALERSIDQFDAHQYSSVVRAPALEWLGSSAQSFDGVFVDPPFDLDLWEPSLQGLRSHLNPGAWVYLERPSGYSAPWLQDWDVLRESRAGESLGCLLQVPAGD